MKVIDKEAFFAADDLPLTPVPLPDMYGKDSGFYIRTMTGTERSALEKRFMSSNVARQDPGGFRATVLAQCVVDADGEHIFSEKDREKLMAKNAGTLEVIFTKVCEVNGLTKKDVDDIAKNSETTQENSTSTGSVDSSDATAPESLGSD